MARGEALTFRPRVKYVRRVEDLAHAQVHSEDFVWNGIP
jgi:hypothetical protein